MFHSSELSVVNRTIYPYDDKSISARVVVIRDAPPFKRRQVILKNYETLLFELWTAEDENVFKRICKSPTLRGLGCSLIKDMKITVSYVDDSIVFVTVFGTFDRFHDWIMTPNNGTPRWQSLALYEEQIEQIRRDHDLAEVSGKPIPEYRHSSWFIVKIG